MFELKACFRFLVNCLQILQIFNTKQNQTFYVT